MGRQRAPVQVNQFIGGINTEANLLSFPINSSSDEVNLELNRDGSRTQRYGFDTENGYSTIDTGISIQSELIARSQFRWYNPGNLVGEQIMVVQIGHYLGFHSIDENNLSAATLHSKTFSSTLYEKVFDYAVLDGTLVVVTGDKEVNIFEYDGTTVTESTDTLLVRDLFGLEVSISGTELSSPTNFQVRPASITKEHSYNLRNQTFALPRVTSADALTRIDPIADFYTASSSTLYPSNSDNVVEHLSPTASHGSSGTVPRYKSADAFADLPSNSQAPIGYFIIDALERGASRESMLTDLYSRNSELTSYGSGTLPEDYTTGGASCVSEYAGRVWYGGFNGTLVNGDSRSPKMSSYVLFSQIVTNQDQIARCYQVGDPTGDEDPDLVDTDGGFLKIDGAYGINKLTVLGTSLFVFARNGVWEVSGVDQNTFTATSYSVTKVSELGCLYPNTVVVYNNTIFWWGSEGIYNLGYDTQTGKWVVNNISDDSIKTLFDNITDKNKKTAVGYYDYINLSIRWLYGQTLSDDDEVTELVLNTKFGAFTKNVFNSSNSVRGPLSVAGGQPYSTEPYLEVTVGGVVITAASVPVTVYYGETSRNPYQSFYCIILGDTGTITYTFGGYKSDDYNDWKEVTGLDSLPECYLITGDISGSEGRLRKDVPYLWVHMPYREFSASCLVSARWGWSSSVNTGKWNTPREAYRLTDKDIDLSVISTRNKLRGSGPAVAFKFESDGVNPMNILGWEFNLTAKENE